MWNLFALSFYNSDPDVETPTISKRTSSSVGARAEVFSNIVGSVNAYVDIDDSPNDFR